VLVDHQRRTGERAALLEAVLVADPYLWSQDPTGGTPWRPARVTDAFRQARRRVGLDNVEFHHLRHFTASTLAGAGVDVRTIAGRLGHANPAVTIKTYSHFLGAARPPGRRGDAAAPTPPWPTRREIGTRSVTPSPPGPEGSQLDPSAILAFSPWTGLEAIWHRPPIGLTLLTSHHG